MASSHYIRTRRYSLPDRRRSRMLSGSFEDTSKWYKCWNCNFTYDITKTTFGGTGHGNTYIDTAPQVDPFGNAVFADMLEGEFLLPKDYSITDPTMMEISTHGGCPLCGTYNLP